MQRGWWNYEIGMKTNMKSWTVLTRRRWAKHTCIKNKPRNHDNESTENRKDGNRKGKKNCVDRFVCSLERVPTSQWSPYFINM